jgi:DNA-directed RNA polymerase subunit RPC12/RpoP
MIEYLNGKEYWNGKECTGNFVYRTLADMFPEDYERYRKESMEFKEKHTVLHCSLCSDKWVHIDTDMSTVQCPSCKSIEFEKL